MNNPAVERLLNPITNPVLRTALIQALRTSEPIVAENVPEELLGPCLILATVGREYGERRVDDFGLLRKRTEEESEAEERVVRDLLAGASLNMRPHVYPPSATMNCAPGEIQLHYLPIGARFRSVSAYGSKLGTLVDKTASRATVVWEGGKKETDFVDRKTGQAVHFVSETSNRTGCALESPVVPIHQALSPEDLEWITNAYKELTGAFASTMEPKKGKRRG